MTMKKSKSMLILLLIIVATFSVAFVPGVSASVGPSETPASSSGRVIIGFKQLPWTFPILDFVANYGGGQVAGINYALKFAVVVPRQLEAFLSLVSRDPRVSYVEPDGVLYALFTPNDPSFPSQWGPPAIHATSAWDITLGSKSVVVAVVDTGVQYDHPDLSSNMWKNSDGTYGCNYVNSYSSSCGNTDVNDDNGHGTHVAGIVAATIDNGIGVAGISQSSIMAVKVLGSTGSGQFSWVANGIQWAADHGANIISMSLGGGASSTLLTAVQYAYSRGVLLVAAAGNTGYGQSSCGIKYPAYYDQVIAVTAIDQNSQLASFSCTGPKAELTAPGVNIYSTYYGSRYTSMSGTSMATPFVSGVAALVWSVAPSTSRDDVRSLLDSTADDLGTVGRDNSYGYGRVNALAAVEAAGGTPPPPPTPDFTITLLTTALTVTTGGSGQVNVQVKGVGGFADAVTLSTDGLPAGVTSSFSQNGVPPDFTATLTITADTSASPGSYSITVKAEGGGKTKTQSLGLQIVSASNKLLVTVTTDKPTYSAGSLITVKVWVTDGSGNRISGASIEVKVYYPSGVLYKKFTGTSNANGYYSTYFKLAIFPPAGTYRVTATATKTGYLDGSGSTSFRV